MLSKDELKYLKHDHKMVKKLFKRTKKNKKKSLWQRIKQRFSK